ncbi:MAG: DUF5686 and carboxypeptidase regulatory-like domain-containing protein [Dysgonamonadaceae bacterium]|jgi:hypothetical protein|nr:DUF5686 and carboxypeptidase regulatory-like domain-containing protein [Dysgonamonadaceae bacterium]
MKHFISLFVSCLLTLSAFSQTLSGRITDESGQPVPAASIYIREQNKGLIANENGAFQVRLPAGEYHLEIRCLGYESENRIVRIDGETTEWTVQLKSKAFLLQELEVQAGEDPAYAMMRKAIQKAPYYQYVVKESAYEAYVKGSGKMTHIPELINQLSKGEANMYKDKLFIQESFSEYQFIAPDSLRQNVIAYSSTFPNMNNPQMALATGMASLYHPMFGAAVSPFNPKAFDYYRFRYEGYDEENDQIINKIRIIPKLKDPKLLEGVIYLTDDEWSVRNAELTLYTPVATIYYVLNYHWVTEDVYLLANYEVKIHFNVMGITVDAGFLSSLHYKDIQVNDSLMAVQQKKQAVAKRKEKKSLEIKNDSRMLLTSDSLALKRDSAYWASVRTVELNEEEIRSYQRKDTIQTYTDSLERSESHPTFKASDVLMGGSLGNDSSFLRFRYEGLLRALKEYNFVDGYHLGQSFTLDFKKKRNTGWIVSPSFHWATARPSLLWQTDAGLDYAPKRLGRLKLSAGSISEDFNGPVGASRLANSVFVYFGGYNYIKFYEKTYGRWSNQIDIANGLQLTVGMELAERNPLTSHTNWYLFGKKEPWESNIPHDVYPSTSRYTRLAQYAIHLKYTPEYYYRMQKGKKRYIRSRFPTFELDYRQGARFPYLFPSGDGDFSLFRQLEASITQTVKAGLFSRWNYTLAAGKFLNDNPFNYIDYKHFNVAGYVTVKSWDTSYALLPYYQYSTNDYWLQAFVNYNTDYLLLKRLSFFQGKMFTETLQAKFLHTMEKTMYSEWGYSVDWGMGVGCLGIFVALDEWKYNGFGVRFSMPLLGKRDGPREITISF